ncbi:MULTISPECIES: DUF4956 domain-containing protein [unclassified Corynebacterium]|uniref:DUF4956 domain-containing protein n=1 Tax=unclassified Corynebacterium TaxID=2624378 RepID=UPI0029CA7FAA|nr:MULTISPECIES: DUF4956 domain-containing protein [unclassified Corynebacterium]WPF67040.1 DUF4956 domain-containing protein [Corynebacterium sp. 22KM0430]WPF69528.1 DUF4956 domain-containing protein [Corynebacterium sp. 21KM1197]
MPPIPPALIMPALDVLAISVLVFAIYFPRHRRTDLVVAFLGVNIGVFGVATTLASHEVGMGLGMGLFGVLSIIRLRSSQISQTEVAYYFAALAIGLVAGLSSTPSVTDVAVIVAIVAVLALADSRWFTGRSTSQEVMVERAIADRAELVEHLEQTLGARVLGVKVIRLDCVNDTTWVSVNLDTRPARVPASTVAAGAGDPA